MRILGNRQKVGSEDMKILLVEDDQRAAAALERSLREQGFSVEVALDGAKGLELGGMGGFDCLILDVMLPGMDGFSLLWELRAAGMETPVIFLTARDTVPDKVRGLELGGGDYLVKPFAFSELLLRINNLLARGSAAGPKTWVIGDLTVNPFQRKVYRGGDRIDLSSQEYTLLEAGSASPSVLAQRKMRLGPTWNPDPFEALWNVP